MAPDLELLVLMSVSPELSFKMILSPVPASGRFHKLTF